jgi:hypothetical protein
MVTLTFKFPGAEGIVNDEKTYTQTHTNKHKTSILGSGGQINVSWNLINVPLLQGADLTCHVPHVTTRIAETH